MSRFRFVALALAAMVLVAAFHRPAAGRSEEATIRAAEDVLAQFLDLRVKQIPASLLAEAHGVAIIPDLIKVGFVLGGQRGKGVVVVRQPDGSWRAPTFVTLTGGSIGWQAGAQSTDIVLVFKTQKSVEGLMRGKFTLGADAAVAAGPVGRRAGAATDGELKAEIYSYSRSRGLFAGLSIDGSALQIDDRANADYYGGGVFGGGQQPVPESALRLVQAIANLTANSEAGVELAVPEPGVPTPAAPRPNLLPSDAGIGVPATGTVAPALGDPRGSAPATEVAALKAELAKSATAMTALLDASWQRHLALPIEVFQADRDPSPASLAATLQRYEAVARGVQYRALAERPEFQTTYGLLKAYAEALAAGGAPRQLTLPPPPNPHSR